MIAINLCSRVGQPHSPLLLNDAFRCPRFESDRHDAGAAAGGLILTCVHVAQDAFAPGHVSGVACMCTRAQDQVID